MINVLLVVLGVAGLYWILQGFALVAWSVVEMVRQLIFGDK